MATDKAREYTRDARVFTLISILVAAVGFVTSLSGLSLTYFNAKTKDASFQLQLSRLNDTESSLQSLLEFVDDQRKQLQQSEQVLHQLKQEHERLKPVVEADQKVVAAVLAAQADHERVNKWGERLVGFGFGILGSLVAALIWQFTVWLVRRRQLAALREII